MPKPAATQYISDTQYQSLKRLRTQVAKTLEFLNKCEKCKFDVSDEIAKTKEQLESINQTLIEFGPPEQP